MRVVPKEPAERGWEPNEGERVARGQATVVLDQCLALALGRARREIEREYDGRLRPLRLTTAQLRLLAAIALRGPIRNVDLARLFGTRRPTVTRTVQRMWEKGWLEVVVGDDLSSELLVASEQGLAVLRAAYPLWKVAQNMARARLAELLSCGT